MTYAHTKIDSKGACIYCGRSDVLLTDEHVVPLFIGGQLVIKRGSCGECAKVTTRFERDVARELWGDARISYNAPSRRKKSRETHVLLRSPNDPRKFLKVPYSEYPAPMVFYKMHSAGILQGLPEDSDISNKWEFSLIMDESKRKAFLEKYPGQLTAKFRHVPESFARMIAKIGYGQALFHLNPDDFRPICVPYIMGKKKNLSYVVGSSFEIPAPIPNMGYILETACVGDMERLVILSEVRLIANNPTPTYHVVVGYVMGQEKIRTVITKLGSGQITIFSPNAAPIEAESKPHWTPHVWPLKLEGG